MRALIYGCIALALVACRRDRERASPEPSVKAPTEPATPAQPPLASPTPGDPPAVTVNQFLQRGAPTFILGTAADDRADRAVAIQVDLIRNLLGGSASVPEPLQDDAIEVARGRAAWPVRPVVYGGPHINIVLARIAPSLPLAMSASSLRLGDERFTGPGNRLIAVIPGRNDGDQPGYPEFLLYAGTGVPGVAEINAVSHGPHAILVADGFGVLRTGTWRRGPDGSLGVAWHGARARRIEWRSERRLLGTGNGAAEVQIRFPASLQPAADESEVIDACMRGLRTAQTRLAIVDPASIVVYVYPDRGSKRSLTGNDGDGHAVVSSNALHVVRFDPSPGGGLEALMAHEGTHVLAYRAYGAAATPLWGEGLAVWVSGRYAGVSLAEWKGRIAERMDIETVMGAGFRQMPEARAYPQAGLLVEAAVASVGLDQVLAHLMPATRDRWGDACERAGTTPAALQKAFAGLR